MGLDYSFELYYKRRDLEAALLATAAITSVEAPETLVFLPDGKQITLPVRTRDGSNSVKLREGENWLDTRLLFPVDETLGYFVKEHPGWAEEKNGISLVAIGCISLGINLGHKYVALTFLSPGTSISMLFEQSSAIRQVFCEVLKRSNGLAIVYDRQGDSIISLLSPNAPAIQDLLTEEDYVWKDDDMDSLDADIYIEAILRAIVKAESAATEVTA